MQRMNEVIGNGLAKVEHTLEAAPVTIDAIAAELRDFRETAEPVLHRLNASLDQLDGVIAGIMESPMGKMIAKQQEKAAKDAAKAAKD